MKYAIILVLFFANIADAQWIKFSPIRASSNRNSKILEDLSSHTTRTYYDVDNTHAAHELLHFVNSEIRNKLFHQGYRKHNTIYVLNDVGFLVKEPNFKLKDLAQNIPKRYRGQVYNLYLIKQQKDWNDQPSYMLDEHAAYTAGTMCAMEIKDFNRAQDSGFRMLETLIYCHFLKRMANQPDITKIVDWQTARCKRLYSEINITNHQMIHNYELLQEILNTD